MLVALWLAAPAGAQAQNTPPNSARTQMPSAQAPSAQAPSLRANDPMGRALRASRLAGTPNFGMPVPSLRPRQVELAPRPNRAIEGPRTPGTREEAAILPTIINPAIPGAGMATEGMVTRRERRFLETPAAGARFSVPMTW